jgi:cellulose synthase/poly-beta-1,6-N-acetylglucosamine synthase-like glycosyltransferase
MVSVVIPCFNAERWIGEAIQSCLTQSYQQIEVIVIDDGSTDRSLEIINSFGSKIRFETGPNRGGNAARNRGFALSKGGYIQFLDADDYLLPEKIERQLSNLESTGADVAYGDWRRLSHQPDGRSEFEDVVVSGDQADVLEALLGGWWVAPVAVLLRRNAVLTIGGWDESLKAAQDTDLMINLALAKCRFVYQPGCHSIYRKYGRVTVSTSSTPRWLQCHCKVLDKALDALTRTSRLTPEYRHALARSYFQLARGCFAFDREHYDQVMARVLQLEPKFQPLEAPLFNVIQRLIGFKGAERVAGWKRKLFGKS